MIIDFRTRPDRYHHWRLSITGAVATLALDVDQHQPLMGDYELKLNSYDLGVDIELSDAVQRLRFEHPEVGAVVITSAREGVFSAGANIRMLAGTDHGQKVNFCKFTNETRLGIEDATKQSGQHYLCAINGPAAGGGYELALAADTIIMVDDGSTSVSLPEVALLGVLPGTGGLTRLTDKRMVRHDIADYFCTLEEGVRGERAVKWRLVDEVVPSSRFERTVADRASELAATRPVAASSGVALDELQREVNAAGVWYTHVTAAFDHKRQVVDIVIQGPQEPCPAGMNDALALGCSFWPLTVARELDDLFLHLRHNEPTLGTWVLHSKGDLDNVAAHDLLLSSHPDHWFAKETVLFWKRLLCRYQLSARSLFALIEPGSCFAGTLLELVLGADRSFMLDGVLETEQMPAAVRLTDLNFGPYTTINGLSRIEARYLDAPAETSAVRQHVGHPLDAAEAERLRLVTFIPDDIDWEDEVRIAIEERRGFSPDALTGMEANLRCAGPETMASKIFARLTAWQNWIFQRPNATGPDGALARYGTGKRASFDPNRT